MFCTIFVIISDVNKSSAHSQPGPPGQFALPPPGFPQWGAPGWPPQWPGAPTGPPPPIQVCLTLNNNETLYIIA